MVIFLTLTTSRKARSLLEKCSINGHQNYSIWDQKGLQEMQTLVTSIKNIFIRHTVQLLSHIYICICHIYLHMLLSRIKVFLLATIPVQVSYLGVVQDLKFRLSGLSACRGILLFYFDSMLCLVAGRKGTSHPPFSLSTTPHCVWLIFYAQT